MPHGGTCPSSAELPEFLQRQECGTTETASEAPGAYGIRSCSHAARIASYETTSALAALLGPEVVMAPWYTASGYHPAVLRLPQPLDGPCLSTGRGAPRTSVPAYSCHYRCLQHGLGRYMQWAGSLGALDRAPTALAHQLPRAVGSAFRLTAVPATAVGQAQVDLFASPESSYCQLYFSLTEGSLGTDALAHSWPRAFLCFFFLFAFPPVSLLAQTLCKLREDKEQVAINIFLIVFLNTPQPEYIFEDF